MQIVQWQHKLNRNVNRCQRVISVPWLIVVGCRRLPHGNEWINSRHLSTNHPCWVFTLSLWHTDLHTNDGRWTLLGNLSRAVKYMHSAPVPLYFHGQFALCFMCSRTEGMSWESPAVPQVELTGFLFNYPTTTYHRSSLSRTHSLFSHYSHFPLFGRFSHLLFLMHNFYFFFNFIINSRL